MKKKKQIRTQPELREHIFANVDTPNYHGSDKLMRWSPGSVAGGIQRGEECLEIIHQYFYDIPLPDFFHERVDLLRENITLLWQIALTAEQEQWSQQNPDRKISRMPDGTLTADIVTDLYAYLMKILSDENQRVLDIITVENLNYDPAELRGEHARAFNRMIDASHRYTFDFSEKKLGSKQDYGYKEMMAAVRENYDELHQAADSYLATKQRQERTFQRKLYDFILSIWKPKNELSEWL